MAKRHTSTKQTRSSTAQHQHDHEKGRCLNILRQLSAYIDDELAGDICSEIRRHLGSCPNCEVFVSSLRQTVSLCRHRPSPSLSTDDRAMMRQKILKATQIR
ncbi:MAG: zf-HC2 domain-containing protein [Nitrospira sp.]|nr:zf-HC2 domain-containing protein [Nitrospira sp.]